jgi:hypothetical protein
LIAILYGIELALNLVCIGNADLICWPILMAKRTEKQDPTGLPFDRALRLLAKIIAETIAKERAGTLGHNCNPKGDRDDEDLPRPD